MNNKGLKRIVEEDATDFLDVSLNKIAHKIELLQTGIIDEIVEAFGQQDAKSSFTPEEMQFLGKDVDGEDAN
eukprot:7728807-Ditylum_brightwellii.AAC.1